jgi:hypothetical protein
MPFAVGDVTPVTQGVFQWSFSSANCPSVLLFQVRSVARSECTRRAPPYGLLALAGTGVQEVVRASTWRTAARTSTDM